MKQPVAPRAKPPIPAIRLGALDHPEADTRHARRLVVAMRLIALLWMAKGLFVWAGLLTRGDGVQDAFAAVTLTGGAAVLVFCVLDLVAAVGLWLASAWGGVVWLVAVCAQWMAATALPHLLPYDLPIAVAALPLVAIYIVLTVRAARESEAYV